MPHSETVGGKRRAGLFSRVFPCALIGGSVRNGTVGKPAMEILRMRKGIPIAPPLSVTKEYESVFF